MYVARAAVVVDEARVEVVRRRPRRARPRRLAPLPAPCPFPLPFSSAGRCVAAISSASIPASASTWWRRSSVPAAVRGGSSVSTRSRPSMSAVAHLPARRRASSRPASISARASSSAARRAVPGASASSASSSGRRNGSPNQDSARRAAAVRFSVCPTSASGWSSASCMHAARTAVPLLPKSCARLVPGERYVQSIPQFGRETVEWCTDQACSRPISASGRPTTRSETPV